MVGTSDTLAHLGVVHKALSGCAAWRQRSCGYVLEALDNCRLSAAIRPNNDSQWFSCSVGLGEARCVARFARVLVRCCLRGSVHLALSTNTRNAQK